MTRLLRKASGSMVIDDAELDQQRCAIVTSTAAPDPDDLLTARPTDDETINEFGRRVAMIPDELGNRCWSDDLGRAR